MDLSLAAVQTPLLPGLMSGSAELQIIGVGQGRKANAEIVKIRTPQRMDSGQPDQVQVLFSG